MKVVNDSFKMFAMKTVNCMVLLFVLSSIVECDEQSSELVDDQAHLNHEVVMSPDRGVVFMLKASRNRANQAKQSMLMKKLKKLRSKARSEQENVDRRRHQASKWDIGFGKR